MATAIPAHEQAPRVHGIKELVDAGLECVPPSYIRPPHQRPDLSQVSFSDHLPLIDLTSLQDAQSCATSHLQLIQNIRLACQNWGFFQIINHGVPSSVVRDMQEAIASFFEQPAEDRMRFYSEDTSKEVAYATSFNRSHETIHEWKDSLRLRYAPGRFNGFKEAPANCREPALRYLTEVSKLAQRLYKAILQSLQLSETDFCKAMQLDISNVYITSHYYPPCPNPSLTSGLSEHSDINVLTILLQDEVGGLQVRQDNRWIAVKPVVDAFVVNLGDQMQILTNGRYRSVEHRAVTNSEKPRKSIASFFSPLEDATISPLPSLIQHNDPARYKEVRYGDYVQNFFSKALEKNCSLDFDKISL